MAAAERLASNEGEFDPSSPSVVNPLEREEDHRLEVARGIVSEMNRDRNERKRTDAYSKGLGEGMQINIESLVEERLFEEQQGLEAEGLVAQFENTFGRQPVKRRLFGI